MQITYYGHNFNTIDDVFTSFQQQVNTNKNNTIVILNLIKEIAKVIYNTTKDKPVNIRDSYITVVPNKNLHSMVHFYSVCNFCGRFDKMPCPVSDCICNK